jgi:hypothetical protein
VQCGLSVHQQHVTVDQVAVHFTAGLGAWGVEGRGKEESEGEDEKGRYEKKQSK